MNCNYKYQYVTNLPTTKEWKKNKKIKIFITQQTVTLLFNKMEVLHNAQMATQTHAVNIRNVEEELWVGIRHSNIVNCRWKRQKIISGYIIKKIKALQCA